GPLALLWVGCGCSVALEFTRLGHRLDDEIGGAHAFARVIGREPVERVADVDAPVADLAVELGGAFDRLGDRLGLHVGEGDGEAVPGAPRRDVAAHGAGADDVDVAGGPGALGAGLWGFAQGGNAHPACGGGPEPEGGA